MDGAVQWIGVMIAAVALAVTHGAFIHSGIQGLRRDLRQEIQGLRGEVRQEIQGLRGEVRQETQGLREGVRQETQGLREGVRQEIQELSRQHRADLRELSRQQREDSASLNEKLTDVLGRTARIEVFLAKQGLPELRASAAQAVPDKPLEGA